MKSSSLRLLKEGIDNPRIYRDCLIHEWYLQPQYIEKLDIYILRETTPEKLFFNLKDGELKIKGKLYSVTWMNSPKEVRDSEVLLLSIRYCIFLERGYALIKVLKGDTTYDILEY